MRSEGPGLTFELIEKCFESLSGWVAPRAPLLLAKQSRWIGAGKVGTNGGDGGSNGDCVRGGSVGEETGGSEGDLGGV